MALVILGVVLPLNNAIGADAFFLRTHEMPAWAWLLVQAALLGILWAVPWLAFSLVRRRGTARTYDVVVTTTTLLVAWALIANAAPLQALTEEYAPWVPLVVRLVLALAVAALIALLFRRATVGTALMVLLWLASAAPLALGALGGGSSTSGATVTFDDSADRPSVLWVIADELTYPAVFDATDTVRARYPTLASLQSQATTYTNAYGLSNKTERAIPAMLAGVSDVSTADPALLESLAASDGLVADLADPYAVVFSSGIFSPPDSAAPCVAPDGALASAVDRVRLVVGDAAAVAVAVSFSDPVRGLFPPIEGKWRDYWAAAGADPAGLEVDAVSCAPHLEGPFLALWHTLTTHNPYTLDPDGQRLLSSTLRSIETLDIGLTRAGDVTTAELLALQRRLYANSVAEFDRRLGRILDELVATGRYDDTLVIVTADHGVSLPEARSDARRGEDLRRVGADEARMWGDVAHVPLLVKYPGQTTPDVVADPRSTAQIMPTVLDEIGATVTAPWDPAPPLDQAPAASPVFTLQHLGSWTPFSYAGVAEASPWSAEDFEPVDPDHPFAVGIDPALAGGPVPAGAWAEIVPTSVQLVPGDSASRVVIATRDDGGCSQPVGLVSADDVVVGSVLWERDPDLAEGAGRGWAIVPRSTEGAYRFWCPVS